MNVMDFDIANGRKLEVNKNQIYRIKQQKKEEIVWKKCNE